MLISSYTAYDPNDSLFPFPDEFIYSFVHNKYYFLWASI